MSNFDYETGPRKPEISGASGGLGLLLLLLVVIGLLALFSFFGGGTTPDGPGEIGTNAAPPAAQAPAAPATAVD